MQTSIYSVVTPTVRYDFSYSFALMFILNFLFLQAKLNVLSEISPSRDDSLCTSTNRHQTLDVNMTTGISLIKFLLIINYLLCQIT